MTKSAHNRNAPSMLVIIFCVTLITFIRDIIIVENLSYNGAQERFKGHGRSLPPWLSANSISIYTKSAAVAADASTSTSVFAATAAAKKEDGLSACLLVNDENPRLPEWIAYHYHLLPLRHLTIAIDPASRSSPSEILKRWNGLLDVRVWNDEDYILEDRFRGPCADDRDEYGCTQHHRTRQRQFVLHCMADFKARNKTWVLLTDVDEYVTFNAIADADDDPEALPLEEAPEGVPTLGDWKLHHEHQHDPPRYYYIEGVLGGLPPHGDEEYYGAYRNGDRVRTHGLVTAAHDVQPMVVVEDQLGRKYFLRDDWAHRDSTALPCAPPGVPTLKDILDGEPYTSGSIYNDTYDGRDDGEWVDIEMDWTHDDKIHGGHVMQDLRGRSYYLEREQELWPRHLGPREGLEARRRLPSVADGRNTIFDVLVESKRNGLQLGACLSMPRLFYGSKETDRTSHSNTVAPEGFRDEDFVTLRYQYHASGGNFDTNLYGKTIIDVSRVPMETLHDDEGALNIHQPLYYYCRRGVPRYTTSLLRVNHYLDSWEAFSYRNDARTSKRQCRECYEEKGYDADVSMDEDVLHWLKHFVQSVGKGRAMMLLKNAGEFKRLGNVTIWQRMQKTAAS